MWHDTLANAASWKSLHAPFNTPLATSSAAPAPKDAVAPVDGVFRTTVNTTSNKMVNAILGDTFDAVFGSLLDTTFTTPGGTSFSAVLHGTFDAATQGGFRTSRGMTKSPILDGWFNATGRDCFSSRPCLPFD